jgi:hypothetical protein
MLKKHISINNKQSQRITGFVVVLTIAVIGAIVLTGSHAASPYASSTASSGTLASGAVKQACAGAGSGNCVAFNGTGGGGGTTTGKYLGIDAYSSDLADGDLKSLHVNSLRDNWDLNTNEADHSDFTMVETSYGYLAGAPYMNAVTAAHITPLPILNAGSEAGYGTAVTTWCQMYCAGGTFWKNNTTGNAAYAPTNLEITNEPYYGAIAASTYATMLKDARTDLNAVGLSKINIISEAGDIWHDSWTQQVKSAGGLASAQGIAIHPYSPSAVPANATCPANITISQVETASTGGGNPANSWLEICYMHQEYNMPVYITEQGWCLTGNAACGDAGNIAESLKDTNITNMIGNFKNTSWITGWWYYNMGGDGAGTYGLYTGCFSPCTQTTAFSAFAAAAAANGFSN